MAAGWDLTRSGNLTAVALCVDAHIPLCHGVLEALDGGLHFLFPAGLLLLLLKHRIAFRFVVLFQIPNLTALVPDIAVEGLDPTVSLVGLIFQLTLLAERFVQAHL